MTNNSSTLLDIIITNSPNSVLHSDVLPWPAADHELLTVTVKGKIHVEIHENKKK